MTSQSYKKISALPGFPGAVDPNAVFPASFMGKTYKLTIGEIVSLINKLGLGLENVDNTSDANKPVSIAVLAALANKANSSHNHNASEITGLSSYVQTIVTDQFNLTPITSAVQQALDNKSNLNHSHDYSAIIGLQNALNNKSDIGHTHPIPSHTHTKAEVGLGNVDNTSDANKPLSSAQKLYVDTAIANVSSGTGPHTHVINDVTGLQTALDNINTEIQNIIGLPPETLNSLQELAAALGNDVNALVNLTNSLNTKESIANVDVIRSQILGIQSTINSLISSLANKADVSHSHSVSNITGLRTELDGLSIRIDNIVASGSTVSGIADVPGLQAALDSKAETANLDTLNTIVNGLVTDKAEQSNLDALQLQVNSLLTDKAETVHTHTVDDVLGLRGDLDSITTRIDNLVIGGSGVSGIQDVPGLVSALDSKVDDSQLADYYTKTEVDSKDTILQTNLNNKAPLSHVHSMTEVTGLTTTLDGKAAVNHTHTKADVGLNEVDNTSDLNKPVSLATQTALNTKVNTSSVGAVNGVASLDSGGKVPSAQLPSYVDDILEFVNFAGFPGTGETGKIYIAQDTNYTYRWSGSAYVAISIAGSGAVSSVNSKTGVVTITAADVGLGNVDNTSDINKPISAATQTALDGKAALSHTHTYTKADVGLNLVDNTSDASKPISTATQTALNAKVNTSLLGTVNGVATLDATGKVPASQLPSFVDDVLEYVNAAAFPATGSSGIIYMAVDTNSVYRWSGSAYVNMASGSGGVTSVNSRTGVVTLTSSDVGLGNVNNTSDLAKPISTAAQTALNSKSDTGHVHAISDVSNLQSSLDGKSNTGHTHTKAEVGLGNVDNTSDLAKPISTATKTYVDTAIAGVSGGGGAGGSSVIYNTSTRYEALSSTGYKVHCVSSSNIYTSLVWSRTGTSLTVNHTAHGRSIGDRVILKNINVQVLNALITNITTDSYTVDCSDTGDTSGTAGMYTCGFKFAHNSEVAGALTGGVLSAPANCDIQLHSMRIHTKANSRAGATYDLTIPTSVFNPAGMNTSADEVYVPLTQIRADADTMTVVGNTIGMNQTGSYSIFRYGALGSVAQGQLMLLQF